MKKKITLLLGAAMILAGAGLLAFQIWNSAKDDAKRDAIEDADICADPIDISDVDIGSLEEDEFAYYVANGGWGIIKIPAIGLKAAVTKGGTDYVLRYYVGWYLGEEPGTAGGNTALAAHSLNGWGRCDYCFFDDIGELSEGDVVLLEWHDGTTYVYSIYAVYEYEAISADYPYIEEDGESLLTLVTCTDGNPNYRTYVMARLVGSYVT